MTETQQSPEWPKEIWLAEREEHDQGCLSAYLSQIGGLADHRYIDADIYESADRYWRERAEKADAERDAAEALNALHIAKIEPLRAFTKPLADTLWLQEEPNSREGLPEEWVAYLEEMGDFSAHYIAKARELVNGALTSPPPREQHPDDLAVDRFAVAMKAKIAKKRADGRGGWQDKDDCSQRFLSDLLRGHDDKGDPVDVANLAMMLHQRGGEIAPAREVRDGTCVECGCAPANAEGFCATCIDERAEGTLQEAAQVLLASVPNPAFDILKPILMGEHSISFPTFDEEGEEYSRKVNVPWDVQKRIVADALRALAQGGQDDE
ncbi:MAG: hypothetical protein ABGX15_01920 [Paracoccaceae bacterium]